MKTVDPSLFKKISEYEWEIEKQGEMNVKAKIFASENLLLKMDEKVKEQLMNVASLPGIVEAAMAMSDAHWGYGFPIGGVAAFDGNEGGVLSVGGVGFDINCGVRTMSTNLSVDDIKGKEEIIADALFKNVPAGLGSTGKIKLNLYGIDEVLRGGAEWAVDKGYGIPEDLNFIEENGKMENADPSKVSDMAKKRQFKEVGTLGSGNHYLEVQVVDKIYDEKLAKKLGFFEGKVMVSFHTGSRALGHQIGMDYLKILAHASKKYGIKIRDRELVCAPISSKEGQDYFAAVNAGMNCAFANRQVIAHLVRESIESIIPHAEVKTFYEIGHNTCKVEKHVIDGKERSLYVHRKGATRAFGPKRKEIPKEYRDMGQPVLIGGSMGTYSYILLGTELGMKKAFGSACHGAGRSKSRRQAKREQRGEEVIRKLKERGIVVRYHSASGVAEEAPEAYKDVVEVVDSIANAGLAKKLVRLRPIINVKG